MKRFLVILFALAVSACATLPPASRVSGFGDAATTTATAVRATFTANDQLNDLIEQEYRASSVLQGTPYVSPRRELDEKAVALRLKAATALQSYAKALAGATDVAKLEALQKAADGVAVTAASVIGGAVPGAAPFALPAGKLVSRVAGFAARARHAAEVGKIIVAVDPAIQTLATYLRQELSAVDAALMSQVSTYSIVRDKNANLLAGDVRIDRLRIYEAVKASRVDIARAEAMAETAAKAVPAVAAMAKAHHALATAGPDGSVALAQFIDLANDLAPLVSALAKEGG